MRVVGPAMPKAERSIETTGAGAFELWTSTWNISELPVRRAVWYVPYGAPGIEGRARNGKSSIKGSGMAAYAAGGTATVHMSPHKMNRGKRFTTKIPRQGA